MRSLSAILCRLLGFHQACRALARVLPLLALACLAPAASAADALPWLNAQRAALGLPPYRQNPELQAKAERDCQTRAARGQGGHLGGGGSRRGLFRRRSGSGGHNLSPGRAEGVGNRSNRDPEGRYFYSCLQASTDYQEAGAAVVVSRYRTFYQLLLK